MSQFETRTAPGALLAFGRRISAGDAFNALVSTRGWHLESWHPTFVEDYDRNPFLDSLRGQPSCCSDAQWEAKQVLRRPNEESEQSGSPARPCEARLMIASAVDLPTLHFVEWHYIDFVLSCLGTVSEAARVLGIRRSTLQRKRKKLPPTR